MFTGDTARMNRDKLMNLKVMAAADDGVPEEMAGGETMRIEQHALAGLLEKSEGIAHGTPKLGLPQIPDEPDIEVVEATAAPVEEIVREPSMPVLRQSRLRDVLIGGGLSILVMLAWYCATQL